MSVGSHELAAITMVLARGGRARCAGPAVLPLLPLLLVELPSLEPQATAQKSDKDADKASFRVATIKVDLTRGEQPGRTTRCSTSESV